MVILEATSAENMSALLEFMYKGEVHVSQEALNSFLKAAENLQVNQMFISCLKWAILNFNFENRLQIPFDFPGQRFINRTWTFGCGTVTVT